jgi:ABC-2 type transport system permease protein
MTTTMPDRRAITGAELGHLLVRRPLRLAVLAGLVLMVVMVGARAAGHSGDLDAASDDARLALAELKRTDPAAPLTYEELVSDPRYHAAIHLPNDVAGLALGFALLGAVAGAALLGLDWSSGTLRLSFLSARSRTTVLVARLAVWAVLWTATSAVLLVIAAAGLTVVAALAGTTDPSPVPLLVWIIPRGALAAGSAALIGACVASALRSASATLVVVISYLAAVETAVPLLNGSSPAWLPSAALWRFVSSPGDTGPVIDCGLARCAEIVTTTPGAPAGWLAVVAIAAIGLVLATTAARRDIWR